ncbi:hypothetical protein LEMLEM_LOCUS16522 [Lemmus lemmus]
MDCSPGLQGTQSSWNSKALTAGTESPKMKTADLPEEW